ncbi:medium chain dehydrogenase/reductase family protein [Candidatus Pelagibacter bacterium]|jgi:Zn-dependent alcohol dehydrogenase|nr:medium chain dehydrogenase/reductase family protein [Candidatus Pelagibacter bacterium]
MQKNRFKSAILFKQKQKLKVIDIENPQKLEKGQVLVKIYSASICGAQIGEIEGIKGKDKWLPHCMGHEGYGLVVSKNKFVKKININDYVVMHWRKGNGINAVGAKYNSEFGLINAGQVTTFQEYAVVSENRLTKIKPLKKMIKLMPLLGCAIPTSWGLLVNEAKFKKEDSLLIFGAGGLGVTTGLIAKILGCKNILLVDRHKSKQNLLKGLGIKFLLYKKYLKSKKKSFSIVIDTTGSTEVISEGFNSTSKNGKLILVGQPKKNSKLKIFDPIRLFNPPNDNIKIFSSDGGLFNPSKHMQIIYSLLIKNYKKFNKLITNTIKLKNINHGIDLIKKGKEIRVCIEFQK